MSKEAKTRAKDQPSLTNIIKFNGKVFLQNIDPKGHFFLKNKIDGLGVQNFTAHALANARYGNYRFSR